ncbi:MAG: phosphate propanoyltransferase [Candidatus Eremiobacteraeota bacterium]|nr:phosphate propanoyltransferase [Candidatus Eremiobacteraeota bacterium]
MEEELIRKIVEKVVREVQGREVCTSSGDPIPINISNRHVHMRRDDLEALFGKGFELTRMRDLMQPGEFASKETVTLVGPGGVIRDVRVLGPVRNYTQVEISLTDSFALGISSPLIRDSGAHEGTPGITVVGPQGAVTLRQGLVIAQRHIHMTPGDARRCGVKDGEWARVLVDGPRGLIFDRVLVRVKETYALEMHLDIDEANACALKPGASGILVRGITL